MNRFKFFLPLTITALFSASLYAQNESEMQVVKVTPKMLEQNQRFCEQIGGVAVDLKGAVVKRSKDAIGGGVCELPGNSRIQAGVSPVKKNELKFPQALTVYAPSGSVPFQQNFYARAQGNISNEPLGGWGDLSISVPADNCNFSVTNVQFNINPVVWWVVCNAEVVGGVPSYATMRYGNEPASGQGVITQYQ